MIKIQDAQTIQNYSCILYANVTNAYNEMFITNKLDGICTAIRFHLTLFIYQTTIPTKLLLENLDDNNMIMNLCKNDNIHKINKVYATRTRIFFHSVNPIK